MTLEKVLRLIAGYFALILVSALGLRFYVAIRPLEGDKRVVVRTAWVNGGIVGRAVGEELKNVPEGATIVEETAVADGPLFSSPKLFAIGLIAAKDGVSARIDGKVVYVTPDELLSRQVYDKGSTLMDGGLTYGVDRSVILSLVAEKAGTKPRELNERAELRRVRFERVVVSPKPSPEERITPENLTPELLRGAMVDMARYLARSVDAKGRYRYLVEATTNRTLAGYNWPRHSGSTFFLAQAAGMTRDPDLVAATLRAAAQLRDERLVPCGEYKCIAEGDRADLGSSALGLIAFTEIARTNLDASYLPAVRSLAEFIRAQQRADGEFKHEYDRAAKQSVDIQRLYYSGEAALGLARAFRLLGDERDKVAASRALAHITGPGWSFFGNKYFWSEEHWTCQAMAELWDAAPDRQALAFCAGWHEYQRNAQYGENDHVLDAYGAFGFSPFVSPHITPASSRGEAAGALLEVLEKTEPGSAHAKAVRLEHERAIAFVLRHQFRPGRTYLFRDPGAVHGGLPSSPVDWQVRIDFPQHAGSSIFRYMSVRGWK